MKPVRRAATVKEKEITGHGSVSHVLSSISVYAVGASGFLEAAESGNWSFSYCQGIRICRSWRLQRRVIRRNSRELVGRSVRFPSPAPNLSSYFLTYLVDNRSGSSKRSRVAGVAEIRDVRRCLPTDENCGADRQTSCAGQNDNLLNRVFIFHLPCGIWSILQFTLMRVFRNPYQGTCRKA